jgi:hypothetical protein
MQNPLSSYTSNLFATHDDLDESLEYLERMVSTIATVDRLGVNTAVHCLLNTLAKTIDDVYHPTKNMSIKTLVDNYLNSHLAERVDELVNEQINNAIVEYMSNEFDISEYDDNIDWEERINYNLDRRVLKDLVEECIKENVTFEVRVS